MMEDMKITLIVMFCFMSVCASAKVVSDEQIWGNFNSFINLKNSWQLYLEVQPRFIQYHSKHGTTLFRGALGKDVGSGLSLWLGYGYIETTNPGYLHEDRPFLQTIHVKDLTEKIKMINRTRLEGRYFRGMSSGAWKARHLLRGQYRFSGSRFGLVLFDEWFWNSNSHRESGIREGFDQNRAFGGVSFFFGEKEQHQGEIGYMNQYINAVPGDKSNDILALQFTFRY